MEVGQSPAQFPAQARGFGLSVFQPPQGVFQFAPRPSGLGGGFQIVEEQTGQSHRVMEGGGGNGFPVRASPVPGVSPLADSMG